jgi:hypothetical protein
MPTILQTFRHLRRYQQIGRILTRYGFGTSVLITLALFLSIWRSGR